MRKKPEESAALETRAHTGVPPVRPGRWEFTRTGASWAWRQLDADETIKDASNAHADLGAALTEAISRGFNPAMDDWIVQSRERITRYSPGKPAVTAPR